jgi:hypothetical protein
VCQVCHGDARYLGQTTSSDGRYTITPAVEDRVALDFDTIEATRYGHRILVKVLPREVVGYVDGNQVYGVYTGIRRVDPHTSTAQAPSGRFTYSCAVVQCMMMVVDTVCRLYPGLRAQPHTFKES